MLPQQESDNVQGNCLQCRIHFIPRHTVVYKNLGCLGNALSSQQTRGAGFPRSIRDKLCPAQDFPSPVLGFVSGCLHTGLRGLFCQAASRKSRRTSLTSHWLQGGGLLNTIAGFHGSKRVWWWLKASELVDVQVLLVKLWDIGSHCHTGGKWACCSELYHYTVTWCCWWPTGCGLHTEDISPV